MKNTQTRLFKAISLVALAISCNYANANSESVEDCARRVASFRANAGSDNEITKRDIDEARKTCSGKASNAKKEDVKK